MSNSSLLCIKTLLVVAALLSSFTAYADYYGYELSRIDEREYYAGVLGGIDSVGCSNVTPIPFSLPDSIRDTLLEQIYVIEFSEKDCYKKCLEDPDGFFSFTVSLLPYKRSYLILQFYMPVDAYAYLAYQDDSKEWRVFPDKIPCANIAFSDNGDIVGVEEQVDEMYAHIDIFKLYDMPDAEPILSPFFRDVARKHQEPGWTMCYPNNRMTWVGNKLYMKGSCYNEDFSGIVNTYHMLTINVKKLPKNYLVVVDGLPIKTEDLLKEAGMPAEEQHLYFDNPTDGQIIDLITKVYTSEKLEKIEILQSSMLNIGCRSSTTFIVTTNTTK